MSLLIRTKQNQVAIHWYATGRLAHTMKDVLGNDLEFAGSRPKLYEQTWWESAITNDSDFDHVTAEPHKAVNWQIVTKTVRQTHFCMVRISIIIDCLGINCLCQGWYNSPAAYVFLAVLVNSLKVKRN